MKKFTQIQIYKDNIASILLFSGVAIALSISNNAFLLEYYRSFINNTFYIGFGDYQINKTILKWVNDGLMAIFFFMLGLEMKYHIMQGEFQNKRTLVLPFISAMGGFIIPAGLYYLININNPVGQDGWAIPIATDTAFVLAIISFFGANISDNTKVYIIGLSIIDDVLAVLMLAIFYTPHLDLNQLYMCSIPLLFLTLLNINKITIKWLYYLAGFVLWLFTVKSGVHGTIAGIILAFFIPTIINKEGHNINLLKDFESSIHTFVAYVVLPIFAFVNCELPFNELSYQDISSNIAVGCFLGLLVGKTLGVYIFTMTAVKLGLGNLPQGINNLIFLGLSFLCGIGFTLSLFIGLQAFDTIVLENQMKIGVLCASLFSAVIGSFIIYKGIQSRDKTTL